MINLLTGTLESQIVPSVRGLGTPTQSQIKMTMLKMRLLLLKHHYRTLLQSRPQCLKLYDGSSDPREHVQTFKVVMQLQGATGALLYMALQTILRKLAPQ